LYLVRFARIGQMHLVHGYATLSLARLSLAGVFAAGLWLSHDEPGRRAPAVLLGSQTGASAAISGRARIVDGDSLVVDGVRVRLEGIDAPEAAQTCGGRVSARWSCGSAARAALAELVGGRHVRCTGSEYDSYGRALATCSAAGRELNAELVRQGLAWAFERYSHRYAALEAAARARGAGIWADDAEPPWAWRERHASGSSHALD
jgi:endonuclease YncB( thermonuclease family)